jgi:hypothetical protein
MSLITFANDFLKICFLLACQMRRQINDEMLLIFLFDRMIQNFTTTMYLNEFKHSFKLLTMKYEYLSTFVSGFFFY